MNQEYIWQVIGTEQPESIKYSMSTGCHYWKYHRGTW